MCEWCVGTKDVCGRISCVGTRLGGSLLGAVVFCLCRHMQVFLTTHNFALVHALSIALAIFLSLAYPLFSFLLEPRIMSQ